MGLHILETSDKYTHPRFNTSELDSLHTSTFHHYYSYVTMMFSHTLSFLLKPRRVAVLCILLVLLSVAVSAGGAGSKGTSEKGTDTVSKPESNGASCGRLKFGRQLSSRLQAKGKYSQLSLSKRLIKLHKRLSI